MLTKKIIDFINDSKKGYSEKGYDIYAIDFHDLDREYHYSISLYVKEINPLENEKRKIFVIEYEVINDCIIMTYSKELTSGITCEENKVCIY